MRKRAEHLRVLVVDDETLVADSLVMILNATGYDATAVYSGESAIKEAMTRKPDVVISDVVMNGMTGIETASRILNFVPACRVVLVSGLGVTGDLLRGVGAAGSNIEIFCKPVHPTVVLDYLAAL
jgi:CheY-like chemotaxis protein